MVVCLDTDHVVEYFRGNEKVVREIKTRIENNEPLFITYINLCELFEGAYLSEKQFLREAISRNSENKITDRFNKNT